MDAREDDKLILNRMITPDGTVLISEHRHDFVEYTDKNGHDYFLDGGNDYIRWGHSPKAPLPRFAPLYLNDPIEEIRVAYTRRAVTDDGVKILPLCDIPNDSLEGSLFFNEDTGRGEHWTSEVIRKELKYREDNKITVE